MRRYPFWPKFISLQVATSEVMCAQVVHFYPKLGMVQHWRHLQYFKMPSSNLSCGVLGGLVAWCPIFVRCQQVPEIRPSSAEPVLLACFGALSSNSQRNHFGKGSQCKKGRRIH